MKMGHGMNSVFKDINRREGGCVDMCEAHFMSKSAKIL